MRYYCQNCGYPIPEPPKEWQGHLVMECPNYNPDNKHGAVDYGLMGSPWISYWNVTGIRDVETK